MNEITLTRRALLGAEETIRDLLRGQASGEGLDRHVPLDSAEWCVEEGFRRSGLAAEALGVRQPPGLRPAAPDLGGVVTELKSVVETVAKRLRLLGEGHELEKEEPHGLANALLLAHRRFERAYWDGEYDA